MKTKCILLVTLALGISTPTLRADTNKGQRHLTLTRAEYEDRVKAAWIAQMLACMMGWQFEHQVASTQWVDKFPKKYTVAPIDDDWYYEMCAIRAFEKYGPGLTVQQLGEQWKANNCGSWGSSEQARLLLAKGVHPPDSGHPRYNKLWFTIGPQFSSDVYGLIAPGMPNLAGSITRNLGHINGYAEGTDGAVFMAGMVSLAFAEKDPRAIVRKAATLINPESPYRKCLDQVISLARQGRGPREVANAIEDRWHLEYPATNNAVANGGIVAVSVWFGAGDFLKTVNIAYRAADFTDADCNAANATAVIASMHGMKCLPKDLVAQLGDRIVGDEMGGVKLTPPVNERISDLARRTTDVGLKVLAANGATTSASGLKVAVQEPKTQLAELFKPGDLMNYWDSAWTLERAGFGGAGGGMAGIRGNSHLEGEVLATWPRDEVRGVVLRRSINGKPASELNFQAGADAKRAWLLEVYANNKRMLTKVIEGGEKERSWQNIRVDLREFKGQPTVHLRLYQRVLLPDKVSGNAYWKQIVVK